MDDLVLGTEFRPGSRAIYRRRGAGQVTLPGRPKKALRASLEARAGRINGAGPSHRPTALERKGARAEHFSSVYIGRCGSRNIRKTMDSKVTALERAFQLFQSAAELSQLTNIQETSEAGGLRRPDGADGGRS